MSFAVVIHRVAPLPPSPLFPQQNRFPEALFNPLGRLLLVQAADDSGFYAWIGAETMPCGQEKADAGSEHEVERGDLKAREDEKADKEYGTCFRQCAHLGRLLVAQVNKAVRAKVSPV